MTELGIPTDARERAAWLKKLRGERTCDTSRALVDLVATSCDGLADAGSTEYLLLRDLLAEAIGDAEGLQRERLEKMRTLVANGFVDACAERRHRLKAIGELISRAVAADKHHEVLEIEKLRQRSDAQRQLQARMGALH